jgi:hypothetical protein
LGAGPLRSKLRHFRDEYEADIEKVKRPAEKREWDRIWLKGMEQTKTVLKKSPRFAYFAVYV